MNVSSPYLSIKTNTVKFGRKHREVSGIMDVLLTNEVTEVVKCSGLGPNANMSKFLKLFTCQVRSHRLFFIIIKMGVPNRQSIYKEAWTSTKPQPCPKP